MYNVQCTYTSMNVSSIATNKPTTNQFNFILFAFLLSRFILQYNVIETYIYIANYSLELFVCRLFNNIFPNLDEYVLGGE